METIFGAYMYFKNIPRLLKTRQGLTRIDFLLIFTVFCIFASIIIPFFRA